MLRHYLNYGSPEYNKKADHSSDRPVSIYRPSSGRIFSKKVSISADFCFGAENEARTRDPNLGKVVLYQLSYFRRFLMNYFPFGIAKVDIFFILPNLFWIFFIFFEKIRKFYSFSLQISFVPQVLCPSHHSSLLLISNLSAPFGYPFTRKKLTFWSAFFGTG